MTLNISKNESNISPQKYNQKALLSETCRLYRLKQEGIALQLGRSQATVSQWLDVVLSGLRERVKARKGKAGKAVNA